MGLFIYGVLMDCANIWGYIASNNRIFSSDDFEVIRKKLHVSQNEAFFRQLHGVIEESHDKRRSGCDPDYIRTAVFPDINQRFDLWNSWVIVYYGVKFTILYL
jgi:hypothetical protein